MRLRFHALVGRVQIQGQPEEPTRDVRVCLAVPSRGSEANAGGEGTQEEEGDVRCRCGGAGRGVRMGEVECSLHREAATGSVHVAREQPR